MRSSPTPPSTGCSIRRWLPRACFGALKPGGRFVGEQGGAGNIAKLRGALREVLTQRGYPVPGEDPQWYASPDEFRAVYEGAGFLDSAQVPETEIDAVVAEAEARAAPALRQPDGHWIADYVRLRFTMRKPH